MADADTKRQQQAEQLILELFSTSQTEFRKVGKVDSAIIADVAGVTMTITHVMGFTHRLRSELKYKEMENALTCTASDEDVPEPTHRCCNISSA